jgi:VWFA-related protein
MKFRLSRYIYFQPPTCIQTRPSAVPSQTECNDLSTSRTIEIRRLGCSVDAVKKVALFVLLVSGLQAQDVSFRSTSRLVLAPISVTDRQGNPVRGLEVQDLVVYDDSVPVGIRLEDSAQPLSLAIVIQATRSSQIVLDKLRKEVSVIGPLLTGDRGEATVIAFANEVKLLHEFTRSADKIERAVQNLDAFGEGGSLIDSLTTSMRLLEKRRRERRRAILLISEKHDRGSKEKLEALVALAERSNATVYALTFSPTKTAFAYKAPKYCEVSRKCRRCTCGNCAYHCDRENPQSVPSSQSDSMNLLALFDEWKRSSQPDIPLMLSKLSGGAKWDFARKQGLEQALLRIAEDLHGQYLVTFPMSKKQAGPYHKIRAEVKGRPELIVRTRMGYFEPAVE